MGLLNPVGSILGKIKGKPKKAPTSPGQPTKKGGLFGRLGGAVKGRLAQGPGLVGSMVRKGQGPSAPVNPQQMTAPPVGNISAMGTSPGLSPNVQVPQVSAMQPAVPQIRSISPQWSPPGQGGII